MLCTWINVHRFNWLFNMVNFFWNEKKCTAKNKMISMIQVTKKWLKHFYRTKLILILETLQKSHHFLWMLKMVNFNPLFHLFTYYSREFQILYFLRKPHSQKIFSKMRDDSKSLWTHIEISSCKMTVCYKYENTMMNWYFTSLATKYTLIIFCKHHQIKITAIKETLKWLQQI